MTILTASEDRLLTSAEVASVFRVTRTTVASWARTGRLPSVRTPGGHRRYRESAVRALLEAVEAEGRTA